jgi:glycosyltransferase involved in cell wall biosynthesis
VLDSGAKTTLFQFYPVRLALAVLALVRGTCHLAFSRVYRGIADYCWVYRVANIGLLKVVVFPTIEKISSESCHSENRVLGSFLNDSDRDRASHRYSLSGRGQLDIFRDVIVLKSRKGPLEKGVILLKYGETYDGFNALFRSDLLASEYNFVLEMSWAGSCDPSYLMFINPYNYVVVEAPDREDAAFLDSLGTNLKPIDIGPGDWVDRDDFQGISVTQRRVYDVVMIANWGPQKNHHALFSALARVRDRELRVLLIGFPWQGRTKDDILRLWRSRGGEARGHRLEIAERIPHREVLGRLAQSKCSVLLSRKEGGNKAITEGFFMDVPAVVYDRIKGGARERINRHTGLLSSFRHLSDAIVYVLDHPAEFHPRQHVMDRFDSGATTLRLNEFLRALESSSGRPWTVDIAEKANKPNLCYKNPADRTRFTPDYERILHCRR